MRVCFPGWFGPRGSGLGNELIPLAKAFIASCELGIKLLPTAWGLNERNYRVFFGTSRFDWVRLLALKKLLPAYTFRESDYLATGERDYGDAIRVYAERMGLDRRRHYALMTDGLWGEYYAIRKAIPYIAKTLYSTRYTLQNLYDYNKRIPAGTLTVAVNIRMTDFAIPTPGTDFRGLWNTRIPIEWYVNICRSLRDLLRGAVTFLLITDGTAEELSDFIAEFKPVTNFDQPFRDISGLLTMANADALVCSISSYSQWAAVLSNAPYFWYRPHLRAVDGYLTIWASLTEKPRADDAIGQGLYPRGVPVGADGDLPAWLADYFHMRRGLGRVPFDLVRGGGVPQLLPAETQALQQRESVTSPL